MQGLPVTVGKQASCKKQLSEGLHWTEQNGTRSVCRGENEGWCVGQCGWRAFVKKRDDFFFFTYWSFTLLGNQTDCKSCNSEPNIKWVREGFGKAKTEQLLVVKEWISLWLRLWKVKHVGCNLWLRKQFAQTFFSSAAAFREQLLHFETFFLWNCLWVPCMCFSDAHADVTVIWNKMWKYCIASRTIR